MATEQGGTRHRALKTAGLATIVAFLVALFDPLGLDQAGDRRSAEAADRVAAPFYPSGHGRALVTTVPIDEAALRSVGREWPPQYDFYAEVLDALTADAATRPAAIFLDFTFMSELYSEERRDRFVARVHQVTRAESWTGRPECHTTPTAKLRCIIAHGGTPVIIGKPYPVDRCDLTLTLLLLDRAAVLTPLGWPGMGDAWRSAISRDQYRSQRRGDEEGCPALEGIEAAGGKASFDYGSAVLNAMIGAPSVKVTARGVARYDLTPSAALFAALCLRDRRVSPHCGNPGNPAFEAFLARETTFKVFWGSIPDPAYLAVEERLFPARADVERRERCRRETAGPGRVLAVGLAQLLAGLDDRGAARPVECGYHADLRYDLLTGDTADPAIASDLRRAFVAGRAVIVGAALAQSNDWTVSPTRGRVPGMNLHAMALDNLLELGGRMPRPPPAILGSPIDEGEAVELILTFLMTLLIVTADERAPAAAAGAPDAGAIRRRRLGLAAMSIGGSLLVFVVASLFLTTVLRWTPVNIVGLWVLSVTVAFVS
ncbi:MAG TPA: CHASE2 domain-containing protein, partial [Caulobacter sp.]|nr:CHASE2 domain-containing protein [Caulobacter sp.]